MEDIIHHNQDYQILICRLCQVVVRPGGSIETHFRQKHLLKGQVLKDIKDYYGTLELADPIPVFSLWSAQPMYLEFIACRDYSFTQSKNRKLI